MFFFFHRTTKARILKLNVITWGGTIISHRERLSRRLYQLNIWSAPPPPKKTAWNESRSQFFYENCVASDNRIKLEPNSFQRTNPSSTTCSSFSNGGVKQFITVFSVCISLNSADHVKIQKWYGHQEYYISESKYITSGTSNKKYISFTISGYLFSLAPLNRYPLLEMEYPW